MQQKSRAIILKRIAYGEADWIVTFLDRDAGRISGIAKFARSSLKRFGGALEPGTVVDIRYVLQPSQGLARIDEACVCRSPNSMIQNLERISSLARAIELSLAFLQEHQSVPDKFDLLERRLEAIGLGEVSIADRALFELEWLKLSGFGPQLKECILCGISARSIDCSDCVRREWSFDFDRGGVLCGTCQKGLVKRAHLTGEVLSGLGDLDDRRLALTSEATVLAGEIIARYIDHILGRSLRVWSV